MPPVSRLTQLLLILCSTAALGLSLVAGARSQDAPASSVPPTCARTAGPAPQQATAVQGSPCWVEIEPYPFGTDGGPVDRDSARCRPQGEAIAVQACFLEATSLAFRAWNRGLAATPGGSANAFGVWLWNGARWFPDPTFPGNRTCPGDTVLWAGKRDYWLVGAGTGSWPSICRFDGSSFLWQPLAVPSATVTRATLPGSTSPRFGGISTGACYAWDDCWFFGTYGSIVRWDGKVLRDASPPVSAPWLAPEWTDATSAFLGPPGTSSSVSGTTRPDVLGLVVGATSGRAISESSPLPAYPDGRPPAQLMTSAGAGWTPNAFTPFSEPVTDDPFRTDLVAVDYDPARALGWVAGVPTGHRARYLGFNSTGPRPPEAIERPAASPVTPIGQFGLPTACAGPTPREFGYTNVRGAADAYLWSSIAAFPGTGEVLVGGQTQPPAASGAERRNEGAPEPVIVQTGCDGRIVRTRFRQPDPTRGSGGAPVPVDARGTVLAVAALAVNDAWASTSRGGLWGPDYPENGNATLIYQAPRLYRLTDGETPQAPDGDDLESRPLELREDPPIVVFESLPPPPPEPVPVVTASTRTVRLQPAIFAVKAKVVKTTLTVSFRVRRPVMLGVEALQKKKVVGQTGLRRFARGDRRLVLRLRRDRWPTAIRFVTDAPTVTLVVPAGTLSGSTRLRVRDVSVLRGRKVKEVRYEVAPAGKDAWTPLATATTAPWSVLADISALTRGQYQIRAILTDSQGRSAVSAAVRRGVSNPVPPTTTTP